VLYANKVGPFANPNEVYNYYKLPYCAPQELEYRREDLGALMKGDRATKTLYQIRFLEDVTARTLCKATLSRDDTARFKAAILDDYYFELMLDELPIWGYVGELEAKSINFARAVDNSTRYFLFTHLDFSIAYNGKAVIEVNVTADPLQRLDLSTKDSHQVDFSYSVRWIKSDVPYAERMGRCSAALLPEHSTLQRQGKHSRPRARATGTRSTPSCRNPSRSTGSRSSTPSSSSSSSPASSPLS